MDLKEIVNTYPISIIILSYIADCKVYDTKGKVHYLNSRELHTLNNIKSIIVLKTLYLQWKVDFSHLENITGKGVRE